MEALAVPWGKVGVVVVKRRAGRGQATPRLVVLTETSWGALRSLPIDDHKKTEEVVTE